MQVCSRQRKGFEFRFDFRVVKVQIVVIEWVQIAFLSNTIATRGEDGGEIWLAGICLDFDAVRRIRVIHFAAHDVLLESHMMTVFDIKCFNVW